MGNPSKYSIRGGYCISDSFFKKCRKETKEINGVRGGWERGGVVLALIATRDAFQLVGDGSRATNELHKNRLTGTLNADVGWE